MFKVINNYIYLYHIDKFLVLPTYPESISDSLSSTFTSAQPLSRSAPIYSYSYSGPRTIQVTLDLHRDMMNEVNYSQSNINVEVGDDYIDTLINQLQAIALPKYLSSDKMVDPPMVALRFGNDIFIKGVVTNGISLSYSGPILRTGKYARCSITFTVNEITPYDAQSILSLGSFRGISKDLERKFYKAI